MRNLSATIITILFLTNAATSLRAQDSAAYVPCQVMPNLLQNFWADQGALNRFYVIESSPERQVRFAKLYNDYSTRLQAVDFDGLSQECKADYLLFKNQLAENLRLNAVDATETAAVQSWFPFADSIYKIEALRRRGSSLNAQQLALDWFNIGKRISGLQQKLRAEKNLDVVHIRRAARVIDGVKAALKSVMDFYNGYDPLFTWWVPRPYAQLDSTLSAYGAAFNEKLKSSNLKQDSSGIVGQPIGRDEIVRQLQYEMISYTPEEIINIANKEFAWCDAEMLKASRDMGFGDNWKAALEKVKNTYVPAGQQPEAVLKLYNESVDFLKKNDLVTIPSLAEETWRMNMMSPERQLTSPFFLGGEELIISYPTNTMDEDARLMSMRGNNPHFSRATVHHELIAGHGLEFFMMDRYRSYRHFETPFWIEGWSLYWEFLLWDKGFPQSPEDRIGMLFWRMHRCARIIFSLNYHMGKWTPQQCIDFLVDRVGHERANAEGEVRRSFVGGYSPLYQLAYMVGGLQFNALRNELVESGKMTYKQYHDAVLHLNMMPVAMVRAILINQPLQKNSKLAWKFY